MRLSRDELLEGLREDVINVHYQPQIAMSSGEVTGAEALLRWEARGGREPIEATHRVRPADVVHSAEDHRVIAPIGQWVLERALSELAGWHQAGGTHLNMAVNVSARQLFDDDFVAVVDAALQRYPVSPGAVTIEIIESGLSDEPARMREQIQGLGELGCHLALDDFGGGEGTLIHLQELPLDEIKLDRGIVGQLDASPASVTIVQHMIALAESLNLAVVAEGIETEAVHDIACQLGCHRGQGFLYGGATDAAAMAARIGCADSE